MDLIHDIREPNWILAIVLVALGMIAWRFARSCQRRAPAGNVRAAALLMASIVLYLLASILVVGACMALDGRLQIR
jgi:hypothetical protein